MSITDVLASICFGVDILCAVVMVIVITRAPLGWEDETGFHRGRKVEK